MQPPPPYRPPLEPLADEDAGAHGRELPLTAWRPRRKPRPSIHALLFVLTVATTFGAGITTWGTSGATSVWAQIPSAAAYAFWTLLILGTHEMGHYLACRYYGIPATLPYFIPGVPVVIGTFGAVIRIRGVIPHRRALFDVAAAGPLAGFAIALPVFVWGLAHARPGPLPEGGTFLLGSPLIGLMLEKVLFPNSPVLQVGPLYGAGWVGMLVTSLNLFPVGQLDGGHAGYALSRRLHRWLSRVTIVLLCGVVVMQFVLASTAPAYLLWFLILLWMRDRHPRLVDEAVPLGPGRRWLAVLLAAIFLACFIPVPFSIG